MHAIAITRPGGPEVLALQTLPVPVPAAGEMLIKVAAAGVNRPDCLQRAGIYPAPADASPLPGLEVAGEVVAWGDEVDPVWQGALVCALVAGGGYAQYCLARPGHCLMVPEGLSLAQAAAMPETLFTVWHNVFERGMAREDDVLLVHGGTSGIGSMAIALGKLFGLTVVATCGSAEKCAAARANGADLAINYREEDFVSRVLDFTSMDGANVILDMVAGSYTQRNLDCLATEGRLVTIAGLGGARATINVLRLMMQRQVLTGSTLRPRSNTFKAMLADEIAREVWPYVCNGQLRPVMDRRFPLADAAQAHARMEAGEHIGKMVLIME